MSSPTSPEAETRSNQAVKSVAQKRGRVDWERSGMLYARLALGAAFLSGIADRFGLYSGRNVGMEILLVSFCTQPR